MWKKSVIVQILKFKTQETLSTHNETWRWNSANYLNVV
jgi:hypothetical protein